MTTQPISGLIRDGCCYHQPMPPLLLPNSFSIDRFLDQTGAGPAIQKSFQPTDCRPNGGGSTQHLQPTDFWTKRGRVLLPNHLFNRPIVGPHGGGCCYPTIFSTNRVLDQTGAGAATQPFFQLTEFWTTRGRVLLPNHFFNRPIFGPNGGGCCYPTIFSTDRFLDHTGAGAATQPFFHPTDFWITQERALLPNIHRFTQNDDTPIEPPYTPTDHPQNLRHQLIHQ